LCEGCSAARSGNKQSKENTNKGNNYPGAADLGARRLGVSPQKLLRCVTGVLPRRQLKSDAVNHHEGLEAHEGKKVSTEI
jgi:hypothetical protein